MNETAKNLSQVSVTSMIRDPLFTESQDRDDRLRANAADMRKLLYAWRKGLGSTEDLNRITDRLLAKVDGRTM